MEPNKAEDMARNTQAQERTSENREQVFFLPFLTQISSLDRSNLFTFVLIDELMSKEVVSKKNKIFSVYLFFTLC